MSEMLKDRVTRLVKETGKSAAALAREGKLARTYIYDVMGGRQQKVTGRNLDVLARLLHVTAESLVSDDDGNTLSNCVKLASADFHAPIEEGDEFAEIVLVHPATRRAAIDGKVEAGSWRLANDDDQTEPRIIDVPADDEYPRAKIRVYEIAGDSMNAYPRAPIQPGALAVCLDYEDVMHRMPKRNGMVVVVERQADGGQFRERSIKEIEIHDDRIEFHPRSTNPVHKPIVVPIDYEADDGVRVQIVAVLRRILTSPIRF